MTGLNEGTVTPRTTRTLESFLDEWLVLQTDHIRPTTLHSYAMAVGRINKGLGKAKLQALTPLQIERFYADLMSGGRKSGGALAPKTVRNTHTVLRKALSDADRLGLIGRNPAASAHPPADNHVEFQTWTAEQMSRFLEHVRSDRLYAAWVLLATTGMRRGEVIGLRWRDVDFDGDELAVANTLTTAGYPNVVSGPPKTARSRRHIYLDDGTMSVLREHRREQREERLSVGPAWNTENEYVFTDELGNSLEPGLVSRMFKRHLIAAGLPRIRLHDVRHSYATLALKAGVHPKVVSERLGHSTIAITLDLYSHVTPSIARDAANVVASRILSRPI